VPPPVLQISRETIKEGKGAAHRKTEQDFANAFRKNKFPYYYLALNTESGSNEVWFADAFPSFAAMEESDRLADAAPLKGEIALLDARDGELRTTSRSMTAVLLKDSSYMPANGVTLGKTRYVMIETFRVRLGHEEDFTTGGKMFIAAYKKSNSPSPAYVYQVIAGAPDATYMIVLPMASLKEMDEQPAREKTMMDAMGADNFSRMMKSEGDVFQTMESTLFAVSPEMSYVSKETEDEDPGFWRPKVVTSAVPAKSKDKTEKAGQ
jgi:hypothetical protein